jgi:hypothetical protein
MHLFVVVAAIVIICVFICCTLWYMRGQHPLPPVYAIMITGKDACRLEFAKQSIKNFHEQDYAGVKRLVIINHGHERCTRDDTKPDIFEFQVEKGAMTLGDLRNIALELVPIDALWTVWDDDDYRSPRYISTLQTCMHRSRADAVVFTTRTEYNHNTGLVWKMTLNSGFVTVLAKQDKRIKYQSVDSMEDVDLVATLRRLKKVATLETELVGDDFYIRVVHIGNTSRYVNKTKETVNDDTQRNVNYIETRIDLSEQAKIRDFMSRYFRSAFQCIDESAKT